MNIQIDYSKQFREECEANIERMINDTSVVSSAAKFEDSVTKYKYVYNWSFMGRPIIQYPQDILSTQEAIMKVKPSLIIETGVAHGGSAVFHAAMLELLGDSEGARREVVTIEVELRPHNRAAIMEHPMNKRIRIIDGSSTDSEVIATVREIAKEHKTIMLILDSDHTHRHVLNELNAYADLVTVGSYAIVNDTGIEFCDTSQFPELPKRPWSKGSNPHTAVMDFLHEHDEFVCDKTYDNKAILTSNIGGWLLRIK